MSPGRDALHPREAIAGLRFMKEPDRGRPIISTPKEPDAFEVTSTKGEQPAAKE